MPQLTHQSTSVVNESSKTALEFFFGRLQSLTMPRLTIGDFASTAPAIRPNATCIVKAISSQKPFDQFSTTWIGVVGVKMTARSPTISVRMIAITSGSGSTFRIHVSNFCPTLISIWIFLSFFFSDCVQKSSVQGFETHPAKSAPFAQQKAS